MKVKINVAGEEVKYDVKEELFFDIEHVFSYFGHQAANVAWWWSLVAIRSQEIRDAKVELDSMKADLDRLSAQIELDIRKDQDALAAQYGKVTEAVIKAVVTGNPLLAAKQEEINAKQVAISKLTRDKDLLTAMADGFEGRSALLATAGSARRAEVQANIRELVTKTSKATKEISTE